MRYVHILLLHAQQKIRQRVYNNPETDVQKLIDWSYTWLLRKAWTVVDVFQHSK
jgi:hypothetical protein